MRIGIRPKSAGPAPWFRRRRSTTATQVTGAATFCFAAAADLEKAVRFWAPAPRWDVLVPAMLALVSALSWVVATLRAPEIPAASHAMDASVLRARPPLPTRIPRWASPMRKVRGIVTCCLVAAAMGFALGTAVQPHGDRARRAAAISRAGSVIEEGKVLQVIGPDHEVHSGGGKDSDGYDKLESTTCYQHLVAAVPAGAGPVNRPMTVAVSVAVPDAKTSGFCLRVDDWVEVLYAPGRPDLGGLVDPRLTVYTGGTDVVLDWLMVGFAFVLLLPYMTSAFLHISHNREILREDFAAGKVVATRAVLVRAARNTYTLTDDDDSDREQVRELPPRLVFATADQGEIVLIAGSYGDPTLVVGELAGCAGWLCRTPRQLVTRRFRPGGSTPLVFIADDDRVLWGIYPYGYRADDNEQPFPGTEHVHDPQREVHRLPRPARFHPFLHFRAGAVLVLGYAALLPSLLGNPGTAVAATLGTIAIAAPPVAMFLASDTITSVRRIRRTMPELFAEEPDAAEAPAVPRA
ncbi:hypothetical protein [Catenulispora yoronensis]|uniref:hypothetical protein n=1 Tax=Catenulispora yoronensis TaxID=450799 RepID=UPI0031D12E0E